MFVVGRRWYPALPDPEIGIHVVHVGGMAVLFSAMAAHS
jgi:hypothetical protein